MAHPLRLTGRLLAAIALALPAGVAALPAAAAAPVVSAPAPVTGCGHSGARVAVGRSNGKDPNDLTLSQTRAAQTRVTAKLKAKGLTWGSSHLSGLVRIPVRWHVITRDDGTGGVSTAQLKAQLKVLNDGYGGRSAKRDAPTVFQFTTASIDTTKNSDWFDWADPDNDPSDDVEAKTALHRGGWKDLNVYVTGLSDGLLGYSEFPFDTTLIEDGVVVLNESLPGGSVAPYNEGDTLTHEVGHWLGLFHTFENGCEKPGDEVADTPYQADGDNIFSCVESLDTCTQPGKDPVHNFMSYGDDPCLDRFTPLQGLRMGLVWLAYRSGLT